MRSRGAPEIHPADDIEQLLPLADFTATELKLAEQKLAALAPWGQTPLYKAISLAIDEVRLRAGEGPKRIVSITDGFDEPGYAVLPNVRAACRPTCVAR